MTLHNDILIYIYKIFLVFYVRLDFRCQKKGKQKCTKGLNNKIKNKK